jgi:hypothetical protein
VVTAPYFIGTKLEAFHGRGSGDYHASRDLEDLISVVDGRPSLLTEVKTALPDLRCYIADEIGALLNNREFIEALPGHLPGDDASQARVPTLLRTLGEFRSMKEAAKDPAKLRTSNDLWQHLLSHSCTMRQRKVVWGLKIESAFRFRLR